jgi:hypothetical protein
MNEDETVQHIDEALQRGEPAPADMPQLLSDVGTLLIAAGNIVHLRGHAFVERSDVRVDVEMLFRAMGDILVQLGDDS